MSTDAELFNAPRTRIAAPAEPGVKTQKVIAVAGRVVYIWRDSCTTRPTADRTGRLSKATIEKENRMARKSGKGLKKGKKLAKTMTLSAKK